jgi:hypothetical protein
LAKKEEKAMGKRGREGERDCTVEMLRIKHLW